MNIPHKLQNTTNYDKTPPTIVIENNDPNWEQAFNNWKSGKNPTDSPEWKKGVFLIFQEIK